MVVLVRLGADTTFVRHHAPTLIAKKDVFRRQHFLQCPTACEPIASTDSFQYFQFSLVVRSANISEMSDAELRTLVPAVHGVNRFRKLRAAAVVNAASIYPDMVHWFPFSSLSILCNRFQPAVVVLDCLAKAKYLRIALAVLPPVLTLIIKSDLVIAPSVGQNGI